MAWTAPMTAVANAAFTAAQFNTHVRDNLNETAPAKATTASGIFVATGPNAIVERIVQSATVATSQTATSTSYVDLATAGPSVTAVTGVAALVILYARMNNNTAGAVSYYSYAISGASALAAVDSIAFAYESSVADDLIHGSAGYIRTDLTPGTNVFTAKYRVSGGTGTWQDRRIAVLPL